MINPGTKTCDHCGDIVAVRNCIFFHTRKHYITLRADDVTTYVNMEDNTTKYPIHYCKDCWKKFWENMNVK